MSLENLLGLASAKAVAAVAGVTLTVGGTAGVVVATDNAPDDVDTTVVVEEVVEPASDHEAGPDDAAADVAKEIWDFRSNTDLTGCEFGLGVAAIASNGKAPAADDVCNQEGAEEGLGSQGEGAAAAGAGNADRAEGHLAEADEAAHDEARIPADVPVGSADTADEADTSPRGGPETGDAARGDAGPPSDG